MRFARIAGVAVALGAASLWLSPVDSGARVAGSSTYYVDCSTGNDTALGTSPTTAWQSIVRANRATLVPGDQLLFKRGCTWSEQRLDVTWSGSETSKIVIANYGTGTLPVMRNGANSTVKITGSYLVVRGLNVEYDAVAMGAPVYVTTDGCRQPLGTVYGFNLTGGAHHVELRYVRAAGFTAGAHLSRQAHHVTVVDSTFERNSVMERMGADPSKDLGAWGINSNSDDTEIAYNTFRDNRAVCQNQGFKVASNSVELFETQRTRVHHNRSIGDRVFSELGGSPDDRSADNVFAYNLMVSSLPEARFIVSRGAGSEWGPVYRTVAVHNTVYLTGFGSSGIVCGQGCTREILAARSNILWAEGKALYADAEIEESNNIFWSTNGDPTIQYVRDLSTASLVTDPMFVNPASMNFRLRSSSPGVNAGTLELGWDTDLAKTAVPQGGIPDIGAFELL